MNRRNILIIISILTFIVIVGGISYSYFVYNKEVGEVSLTTGDISINLSGTNGNQTLTNVVPTSDFVGMNSSSYFDFTVDSTVDTERIYYEVYLLPSSGNTLDTSYLKTYLTDQSNNEIKGITSYDYLHDSEVENGKVIYKGIVEVNNNGTTRNETKDFRLRLWLDESYNEQTSKTFAFDIYLYAKNVDSNFELPYGADHIRSTILAKEAQGGSCSKISWTDSEDNITYFSGTNNCIDMNYVWYSGKLWRITSIYPDGSMKLITEKIMTSIGYGEMGSSFYVDDSNNSYMYQWLNEDFYRTLYNVNAFIDNSKLWNATLGQTVGTKPANTTMINTKVGLLNTWDYYNSYRCISSSNCTGTTNSTGYLRNGSYWSLLDAGKLVTYIGPLGDASNISEGYGVRPSIILNSNVELTGSGTSADPYRVVGDKETGQANELINTRLSGEYVKLKSGNNEVLFRIIGIENNKTKIITVSFVDNSVKTFGTSTGDVVWGAGNTTSSNTTYTYLNETFYPNLVSTYGNLFDTGTYYYAQTSVNYKLAICANLTSGDTSTCTKTSASGTYNIGIPRYGEMFGTPQIYMTGQSMWLITPRNNTQLWIVSQYGANNGGAANNAYSSRATVHLKSTVKILSGSGTETDPYVVGL